MKLLKRNLKDYSHPCHKKYTLKAVSYLQKDKTKSNDIYNLSYSDPEDPWGANHSPHQICCSEFPFQQLAVIGLWTSLTGVSSARVRSITEYAHT